MINSVIFYVLRSSGFNLCTNWSTLILNNVPNYDPGKPIKSKPRYSLTITRLSSRRGNVTNKCHALSPSLLLPDGTVAGVGCRCSK